MSAMAAPLPQDGLASQLPSELFDEVLTKADVPTLLKIKGVSRSWRAGAQRVLWARLCHREGQHEGGHGEQVARRRFDSGTAELWQQIHRDRGDRLGGLDRRLDRWLERYHRRARHPPLAE